jgi:hypothetical protein
VKPSDPRALLEPRLERAWTTSFSRGRAHKKELSSTKITGANRLSSSSSIGRVEVEKKCGEMGHKISTYSSSVRHPSTFRGF